MASSETSGPGLAWHTGRPLSVTWSGREVQGQPLRFLVAVMAGVSATFSVAMGLLSAAFGLFIALPIAVFIHLPLVALGRNGTIENTDTQFHIGLTRRAFQTKGGHPT